MGYTYKGTVNTPAPVKRLTFDPSKCGTRAGYRQHQNQGVYICTACRAANTAYMNAYNASKRVAA